MTNILNITTDDLLLAYGEPLDAARNTYYQRRIDEAVRMLNQHGRSRGWNLLVGITDGLLDADLAEDIVLRAVGRVLRNEEGLESETENGYSYKLNPSTASGELRIFPSEQDQLFPALPKKRRAAVSHRVDLGGWGPF